MEPFVAKAASVIDELEAQLLPKPKLTPIFEQIHKDV